MTRAQACVLAVLDRDGMRSVTAIALSAGETEQKTRNALVKLYQRRDYMVLKCERLNVWACQYWKISAAGRRAVESWRHAMVVVDGMVKYAALAAAERK